MNLLLITLVLCYAVLAVFVWHFWWHQADRSYPSRTEQWLLLPVLLLHSILIWFPIIHNQVLLVGFGHILNFVSWLMVVLYAFGRLRYPLKGLQLLLYPYVAVSLLLTRLFPGQPVIFADNWAKLLHLSAALLAYGLFGITTLLAILMLLLNRQLHQRRMLSTVHFLPPLLSMEKLMFQGIKLGFVLLTIVVISGTVFARAVFGRPAALSHQTVFGILSWLIYAVILFKHHTQAWRGKKAAWWVIVAFVSLILAYIGSTFVLEIILQR